MQVLHFPDGRQMALDRPRIMGILNVTPDSFSDGGSWAEPATAVEHGLEMAAQGADLIDVGGESTRPGAERVCVEEQKQRVLPTIEKLHIGLKDQYPHVAISIDTTKSEVAEAALGAGAAVINDVAAGRDDDRMLPLAAQHGVPIILMHMLGQPSNMQDDPHYDDVVQEVLAFLVERAGAAKSAGVPRSQIVIDPGIGFGKTTEHTVRLLASLDQFVATGLPVLLGTSRKRFIIAISPAADPKQRLGATCATTALGVAAGVQMFRVHDVLANRLAANVAWAIHHR